MAQPPEQKRHQRRAHGPAHALEEGDATAILPGQCGMDKTKKVLVSFGKLFQLAYSISVKLTLGRFPCQ